MATSKELQEQIIAFVRAFGLHQPEQTPCGQPVTVAEAYTLMELTHTTTLTQNELVERLKLTKSTVSRLVQNMVRRDWLLQTPNPDDGRSKLLQLTEQGRETAATLATARQQKFAAIIDHIPTAEQDAVIEALNLLVEAIRESNP